MGEEHGSCFVAEDSEYFESAGLLFTESFAAGADVGISRVAGEFVWSGSDTVITADWDAAIACDPVALGVLLPLPGDGFGLSDEVSFSTDMDSASGLLMGLLNNDKGSSSLSLSLDSDSTTFLAFLALLA